MKNQAVRVIGKFVLTVLMSLMFLFVFYLLGIEYTEADKFLLVLICLVFSHGLVEYQ